MTDSALHPMGLLLGRPSASGMEKKKKNASSSISNNNNDSNSNNNNNTCNSIDHHHDESLRFDTIDAITTLYASKLMEGYTLTDNGELCFRCHMPLMQRDPPPPPHHHHQQRQHPHQQHQQSCPSSTLLLLNNSNSNSSGPKRICVVCQEEWGSVDSFEQKLVVFSAMQAAQLEEEEEEEDGITATTVGNNNNDDDNNNKKHGKDDTTRGECCPNVNIAYQSSRRSTLDDRETNHGGVGGDMRVRDKYTIPPPPKLKNDATSGNDNDNNDDDDDDITLVMDDLNITSCQGEEDGDDDDSSEARMNIEITLRTRCKSCAMDLPISDDNHQLYYNNMIISSNEEESLLYYPHGGGGGVTECSFCRVAQAAKLGEFSSADETATTTTTHHHAFDTVESVSTVDNFDLLLIQANLDKINVKEEEELLLMDAEDKSVEEGGGRTKEDESSIKIVDGDVPNDYRMMEPIMETDGAEVRLMTDWNYRDHQVDCPREEEEALHKTAQEEREDTESNHGGEVQRDESNQVVVITTEEELADMQPQNIINDSSSHMINDFLSNPPLDKTIVVKGLIAKFLQQNLYGHSGPSSLNEDQIDKTTNTMSSDDGCPGQKNKVKSDPSISDNFGSQGNQKLNVRMRTTTMTSTFTRDPPTTELDPPATNAMTSHEEDVEQVRHVRNLEHEQSSRGMDPPETDVVTLDSRDTKSSQHNTTSTDVKDNVERWFRGDKRSSLLRQNNNNTVSIRKVSIRRENEPPANNNATKRFDRKHTSNVKMTDAATPPTSKFHAKSIRNVPTLREDGEPFMSEDDIRGRLAQIEFQFSRKDTIDKVRMPKASLPTPLLPHSHVQDNIENPGPSISKQRLPLSPTAEARHRRINTIEKLRMPKASDNIENPGSSISKQRLPLSPTAEARHRRIKEDLLARKKALSLHPQSSLVSIE
jgi:hypothetical protein